MSQGLYILTQKHLIHRLLRIVCYVEPLLERFSSKMALCMVFVWPYLLL